MTGSHARPIAEGATHRPGRGKTDIGLNHEAQRNAWRWAGIYCAVILLIGAAWLGVVVVGLLEAVIDLGRGLREVLPDRDLATGGH